MHLFCRTLKIARSCCPPPRQFQDTMLRSARPGSWPTGLKRRLSLQPYNADSESAEISSQTPDTCIITTRASFATQQAVTSDPAGRSSELTSAAYLKLILVLPQRASQALSLSVRQQSGSQRVGKQSSNNAVRHFDQCGLHVCKYMTPMELSS
jgi:hypothetical protein